jgi:hypothetical protein
VVEVPAALLLMIGKAAAVDKVRSACVAALEDLDFAI